MLLSALVFFWRDALAGVTIHMEVERSGGEGAAAVAKADGSGGDPAGLLGRLYVEGERVRMDGRSADASQGNASSAFYRPSPPALIVLDERERSYVVLDRAQARSVSNALAGVRAQVQQALEGMSPEDRARAEQAMAKMGNAVAGLDPAKAAQGPDERIQAVATGKEDEVNGFRCREFEISRGATKVGTACVASWSSLGLDARDLAGLRTFAAFQREMVGEMGLGGATAAGTEAYEVMDQMGGFPVRTQLADAESSAPLATRVVKVERGPIDPALFEIPEGYTKRSMIPDPPR